MSDPLLDVLKQAVPEEKQAALNTTGWQEYLDHLRSLPQSSIQSEKQYLEASHGSIKSTLVSLTQTSYKQFIESSQALSDFTQKFESFQIQSEHFNSDLQDSATTDEDVHHVTNLKRPSDDGNNNSSNNKQYQQTTAPVLLLKNLEKIQDILELPSLAMACVRNGYYSEALDLASHSRRLKVRFTNVKVVAQIQSEIDQVIRVMTVQLFKLLRQQSKLPTLIKVISYLRRVQPFQTATDATKQLQQLFLVSRLHFIRAQLDALKPLKQQTPDKYLKRYIEVYREHVFATVTSFGSIFPDESSSSANSSSTTETNCEAQKNKVTGERLVAEFLRTTVQELKMTVEETSPLIQDQSARNSLWLQIVYCTQSLGRVGADFWPTVQALTSAISDKEWLEAIDKQKDISKRLGHIN